jgi:serine/threonine-protein kinase
VLNPGQALGSWIVEDSVHLGVPRTFRAHHVEVGTTALLKVAPASKVTADSQDRELAALKHVVHPVLPQVLDFGVDPEAGVVWTAFAWADSREPLADKLMAGPLDWRAACRLFHELASALATVHGEGIVHRDLRPTNVLVGPSGEATLAGFDFAMSQAELERLAEAPFGDLAYLAPEVLRDPQHHGAKADVYAFGCLMYEALTARAAFPAAAWGERPDQAIRMLDWKTRSEPLDPGDDAPEWLRSMVVKCTDPDPDRRLPDIEALVGWLDAAQPSWIGPRAKATPAPAPRIETATPRPVMPAPAIRGPRAPRVPPDRPPVTPEMRRVVPVPFQYFAAGAFGCLSALGFSSLLILFVEMRDGTF